MKKINTILFDLDGTLLSMDTEIFTKRYFKELAIKLKDYLTAEEVTKHIWKSTKYMINQHQRVNLFKNSSKFIIMHFLKLSTEFKF